MCIQCHLHVALNFPPEIAPGVQSPSRGTRGFTRPEVTGLVLCLPRPKTPCSPSSMTFGPRTASASSGFPTGSKCGRTIWWRLPRTASETARCTSTTCHPPEVNAGPLCTEPRRDRRAARLLPGDEGLNAEAVAGKEITLRAFSAASVSPNADAVDSRLPGSGPRWRGQLRGIPIGVGALPGLSHGPGTMQLFL